MSAVSLLLSLLKREMKKKVLYKWFESGRYFCPFSDISLLFRLRFVVTKMTVISHTRNTQNGPG